jgi:hypothetical protein
MFDTSEKILKLKRQTQRNDDIEEKPTDNFVHVGGSWDVIYDSTEKLNKLGRYLKSTFSVFVPEYLKAEIVCKSQREKVFRQETYYLDFQTSLTEIEQLKSAHIAFQLLVSIITEPYNQHYIHGGDLTITHIRTEDGKTSFEHDVLMDCDEIPKELITNMYEKSKKTLVEDGILNYNESFTYRNVDLEALKEEFGTNLD